jgi:hypothetical protein
MPVNYGKPAPLGAKLHHSMCLVAKIIRSIQPQASDPGYMLWLHWNLPIPFAGQDQQLSEEGAVRYPAEAIATFGQRFTQARQIGAVLVTCSPFQKTESPPRRVIAWSVIWRNKRNDWSADALFQRIFAAAECLS